MLRKINVPLFNKGYGGNQKTCYTEALKRGADILVMSPPANSLFPGVLREMKIISHYPHYLNFTLARIDLVDKFELTSLAKFEKNGKVAEIYKLRVDD